MSIVTHVYLRGENRRMLDLSDFNDLYAESKNKIWNIFDGWLKEGSGCIIKSMDEFILKICKYTPIMGSSYIKYQKKIENTKSVLNVQNEDDKYFRYSILAKLHSVEIHASHYQPFLDELKTEGITMPMRLQQIPKFENMNDLTINVYMPNKTRSYIWPEYISKRRRDEPNHLLLLCHDDEKHTLHSGLSSVMC